MAKHVYTKDDPQAMPSPILMEYMAKQNIDKQMNLDDAKKWFDGLREALRPYAKGEKKYGKR